MGSFDRTAEDTGNLVSLDHLNLTIVDQSKATLFYLVGLGLTRDPYMMVGLENMWLNAGHQQFHVPTQAKGQVVRGHIGMVVPELDGLRERLAIVAPQLEGTRFAYEEADGYLDVTCPWGNHFHCTGPTEGFGATFGVPYIDFAVPPGSANRIAQFYGSVMRAKVHVDELAGRPAAVVQAGADQSIVFREQAGELGPYDGHHLAVYIADFSGPHEELLARGLVTEESNEHQYRFTDIVDPETGGVLYTLEHEVRSLRHPMYQRPLVNRDPTVNNVNYTRSGEYLNVG
jgi:hypothetical protein